MEDLLFHIDMVRMMLGAVLLFGMQAGFTALESGLTGCTCLHCTFCFSSSYCDY
ncbi:hypothetical protein [Salibacterium lacus]|uniref:Uncharacterized protein n=1 Tax=Salibacterium lacus TaxID=1898109 RepID=A0ABW5T501_9BACI